MLDWFRRLIGAGNSVPSLSESQAEALAAWLGRLDKAKHGLGERSLGYVLSGEGGAVLDDIARSPEAARALDLKVVASFQPPIDERRALFGAPWGQTMMYVRLGKVIEAACRSTGWTGQFAGLGVPPWFELLLWEASSLHPRVIGGRTEETFLDHKTAEAALSAAGTPGDTALRMVLMADPKSTQYSTTRLLDLMPGLSLAVERHPAVARGALAHPAARVRARAAMVLRREHCPLAMFLDEVVALALDSAKTVREVGEAWLSGEKGISVPALRRAVIGAEPSRRGVAVSLLAKLGGAEERGFFQERLEMERTPAIRQVIETVIDRLPARSNEVPTSVVAKHVPRPLGVLGEEARAGLVALFAAWELSAAKAAKRGALVAGAKGPIAPVADVADDWLAAMQRSEFLRPASARNVFWILHEDSPDLEKFLALPDLTLGNVVRFGGMLGLFQRATEGRGFWGMWLLSQLLKVYQRASGARFGLRETAAECAAVGVTSERFGFQFLHEYSPSCGWSDDEVWPYFLDHHEALDVALGLEPQPPELGFLDRLGRTKALAVLAMMPRVPAHYETTLWSAALGSVKADRPLARRSLDKLEGTRQRVVVAVASRNQVEREAAIEWLECSGDAAAIPALRAALSKEKIERLKAAMMSALEALGASLDDLLDRGGLREEAARGLSKGIPAELSWFPFDRLPTVHWRDGEILEPSVITWWLVNSRKLGSPEPGPILRRYAERLVTDEARALGHCILAAWIAEDVAPYPEAEAKTRAAAAVQYVASFSAVTPEQEQAIIKRALAEPKGSCTAHKGMLAVAGAMAGDLVTPLVADYLKTWYGMRPSQCKALLQMLAWVEGQGAVQLLLATATRFRTAGIRQTAEVCVRELAERRGWTIDELADRTVPSADLDGDGKLLLSYGDRAFQARLSADLKVLVEDESGKTLGALPEPRSSDDAEAAANARKQLSASRKQVQAIVKQQAVRLYEAMCAERSWSEEDFRTYLLGHPILSRLSQRVLWTAGEGEAAVSFRPLGDGTLTGAHDTTVAMPATARVRVMHPLNVSAEIVAAWAKHLGDYEVEPLFDQLSRPPHRITDGLHGAASITDFRGHMVEAFKLRNRATKLGYQRGPNDDGAWFSSYLRRLPGLGLEVVIQFTGNQLPEENRLVALETLVFRRTGQQGQTARLGEVPAVLLSESYNDLRAMAAEGPGFDPDWESKTGG